MRSGKIRFSLRSLLILTAVLACLLAGVSYELRRTRHEQAVAKRAIDTRMQVEWGNRWRRGRMRSLIRANFMDIHVSQSLAREIAGCYDLECVCFYSCTFEVGAIPQLRNMPHLSVLWLQGSSLSEYNISEVCQLEQIQELCLMQCKLPAELNLQFAAAENIRRLHLEETGVTLDDLRGLESCRALRFLSVDNTYLHEHDLVALLELAKPKIIGIHDGVVSDDDLNSVLSFPGLERVGLHRVRYSDPLLKQLLLSHPHFTESRNGSSVYIDRTE